MLATWCVRIKLRGDARPSPYRVLCNWCCVGGAGEQLDEAGQGSARRRSRVLDQVLEITYTRVCPCKGLAWSRLPGVFSQPMVMIRHPRHRTGVHVPVHTDAVHRCMNTILSFIMAVSQLSVCMCLHVCLILRVLYCCSRSRRLRVVCIHRGSLRPPQCVSTGPVVVRLAEMAN